MASQEKQQLVMKALTMGVPEHIIPGIVEYVTEGCPLGGFLHSVFSNDLIDSFARADETNIAAMFNIVKFIYNEVDTGCYGSPERVAAWINEKREQREATEKHPTVPSQG